MLEIVSATTRKLPPKSGSVTNLIRQARKVPFLNKIKGSETRWNRGCQIALVSVRRLRTFTRAFFITNK